MDLKLRFLWKERSEQVRRCGNAVCPPIPAALVRANLPELCVAERTPQPADRDRADRATPVCINLTEEETCIK